MEGVDAQDLAQVDAKGFIPDEVRNRIFRKLRMKNENRTCFECAARNPTWCTLSYGAYLCLECSGEHRRKGVHISFVRSVELDSFTPEQIVQMAVGGNGKAWAYFKQYGMGKTGEAGKPVDYTSKVAIRYKQDHDKACKDMCASLGVACKSTTASNVQAPDPAPAPAQAISPAPAFCKSPAPATPAKPKVAAKAVDDPWNTPFFNEAAPVPARASIAKEVPSPASTTSTMTSTPLSAPTCSSMMGSSTPAPREWQQAVPKPSGFAGKGQKAKQIDFDFDFDFLEQEAAKPAATAQPPKVAAAAAELPAAPKASPSLAVCKSPPEAPPRAPAAGTAKFANKKGISSEDFFGDAAKELASKGRYTKFASAGAISSDSFFGDKEDPADAIKQVNEDLAKESSITEMAKSSFMQGSEWFSQYLNKVAD
jgi:ADP-ribosylation factor GTPase-activating protein 2/3